MHHNLTHLSLYHTYLYSEACDFLAAHCDLLQHLEYLDLSDNYYIGSGGTVNLIVSLITFSTIRELHLRDTGIGFEDCKALSELLATSKCIQVLNIGHNNLSPDSIQLIVDGLSHNTSLEKLNMSDTMFVSENVLNFASVLRGNIRLRELIIGWCNIESSDSVHLAKGVEGNNSTQLQVLCVEGDPIGTEGAVAFANMLKMNQCLKLLIIRDDSFHSVIGVDNTLELIESLKHNTTLEELWLSPESKPPSFSTLDKVLQDRVAFFFF